MASSKKSALFRLRWLFLAPIPVLWCAAAHYGWLGFLENKALDWRFRYRGPIEAPVKVVYVDVDSIALDEIGNMPWSRVYFATVAKALIENGGVKAVGMDFVFSDLGIPESVDRKKLIVGNIALGRYLWGHPTPPVVVGASYVAGDFFDVSSRKQQIREFPDVSRPDLPPLHQIEPPETPSLSVAGGRTVGAPLVGLIDTVDGGTRWVRLYAPTSVKTYYAMAVELARIYYGVEEDGIKVDADALSFVRPDGSVAARVPLTRKQMVEINWFSPWFGAAYNPRVSLANVYAYAQLLDSDKPEEKKSAGEFFAQFKDAVVLIGPVDRLLQDVAVTPVDDVAVPKVGVHGNLLKTIVSGRYLRRLPEQGAYALILAVSLVVATLAVAGGGRAVFAKVMAVLSMAVYVGAAFELFKVSHLIIPVVAPLGAAFSTSFVALIWQIVEEQRQKSRIKGMFGTYVPPAIVERMTSGEEPKLGGVTEDITAYFSDIVGFSTISEKLASSPERLVEIMNEFLTACTDIVLEEGGTLDKYIGDAIVAMYGAPIPVPGHAHRACVTALRVQRRVGELREKWKGEGPKWPEIVHRLQTRIGLNTGSAVVGNMGSETRFSYTMMGDDVNIAARMESGAKSWGVYTMCTEATRAASEEIESGRVVFRRLGRITVKGRSQPLPIHELVALSEDASDALREGIALFEQGLSRYFERDWAGAIELFRRSEALEVNGLGRTPGSETNPSLIYTVIAQGYLAEPPPPDWDGVHHMKEK